MSFLPIFDRPNSIGEINSFLRRVVLQNGNSLLTGAESRVTLKAHCRGCGWLMMMLKSKTKLWPLSNYQAFMFLDHKLF